MFVTTSASKHVGEFLPAYWACSRSYWTRIVQNFVIKCLVKDVPQELDIIRLILLIMTRISFIITLIVLRMTFLESMNLCMKFCIDIHGYCFKQTYHSLLWKWISCFILLDLSYMWYHIVFWLLWWHLGEGGWGGEGRFKIWDCKSKVCFSQLWALGINII